MLCDAGSPKEQLDRLFGERVEDAGSRERTEFDRLSEPLGPSMVLFGAGGLGRIALAGLRSRGITPLGFVDNNRLLWGQSVCGVRVFSPREAAARFGRKAVFVVTIWRAQGGYRFSDIVGQLKQAGCQRVLSFGFLFWKYAETFLPYYCIELPHKTLLQAPSILEALDLWADAESRREFVSQVSWRLLLDFDGLRPPVSQDQYFPDDLFSLSNDEVFVDCGAFDGDTLRAFLKLRGQNFAKMFAFEPDRINYGALETCIATWPESIRSNIHAYPLGVGSKRGKIRFDARGAAGSSISEQGTAEIEVTSLDEMLGDEIPTFVKMDIEGAEPAAIAGASRIITENSPILAFSVYHEYDHLWKLPLMVRSLSDNYRFYLRAHGQEGWDLVCYAVPTSRRRSAAG
jgi:FkbM family methyltransferase